MSSHLAAMIPAPPHNPASRGRHRLRVGILELIAYTVASEWLTPPVVGIFKRQLYAIMPQVIATWARQLGHRVTYATYYGQRDPVALLPPGEFDVVIIATSTQGSALAYALATLYRAGGVRTVIGGAHAASYPEDCARFFDTVVTRCDKPLLAALLSDVPPRAPSSAARLDRSTCPWSRSGCPTSPPPPSGPMACGRAAPASSHCSPALAALMIAASARTGTAPTGPGRRMRSRLTSPSSPADSRARCWPSTTRISFHDPNFGVRLDDALDLLDAVPADRRSPYLMQCSMSALTPQRIDRLGETRCLYVAPGLESWSAFGGKLRMRGGQATPEGRDRVAGMVSRFAELHRRVPGLQANFVLGPRQRPGRRALRADPGIPAAHTLCMAQHQHPDALWRHAVPGCLAAAGPVAKIDAAGAAVLALSDLRAAALRRAGLLRSLHRIAGGFGPRPG